MKVDSLEALKKVSQSQKKPAQKNFWSKAGLEPTSFCLADLKKALTSMSSASRSSVAQFSVSASQLIKLIRSLSSLVLKKVTAIVCVFYEKRRLKTHRVSLLQFWHCVTVSKSHFLSTIKFSQYASTNFFFNIIRISGVLSDVSYVPMIRRHKNVTLYPIFLH